MLTSEIYLSGRYILHPTSGSIDLAYDGALVLGGATAQISYRQANGQRVELRLADHACDYRVTHNEAILSTGNDDLTVSWHIGMGTHTILSMSMANRSRQPLFIDDLTVLLVDGAGVDLGGEVSSWRFYENGWQSWSPALTRSCGGSPTTAGQGAYTRGHAPLATEPATDDYRRKHQPHGSSGPDLLSNTFTVIKGGRCSLVAGFVSTAQNLCSVRLAMSSSRLLRLAATCAGDGVILPPGEDLVSESLLLDVSADPFALLDLYMEELATSMRARVPESIPAGWCTWYYFYGENTEDDVLANVAAITEKNLPLEYILQDDGYQTAIGDWTSFNTRFPHGIPWLAGRIREAGFKPGIWLAPFGVAQDACLYAAHPDWVLRDDDGSPLVAWQHFGVEAPILALDCTNPQVQNWLRTLFRTMAEEWGIEMFKIDFCFAAALSGRRHDPSATRAMALRQGLEVIREAIGDRFLLGCGLPLGPAVGIVDGMRISTDVAITWKPFFPDPGMPATRTALLNVVTRFATHGRLWLNDPDCLIARDRADENDLKPVETLTLATVMGLSGGMILSGDNMITLKPQRLRYLRQLLPPSGHPAMPLDLFERDMPRLLALPCDGAAGQYLLLAAINWDDRTASIGLDAPGLVEALGSQPCHAFSLTDKRQARYLGVHNPALEHSTWTLHDRPPHSTTLLLLKPVSDHPGLLASTFHILGGLVEVTDVTWEDNRLAVTLEKPGRQRGSLVFTLPEPYRLHAIRVNGRTRRGKLGGGILEVPFTLADRATVEVEF